MTKKSPNILRKQVLKATTLRKVDKISEYFKLRAMCKLFGVSYNSISNLRRRNKPKVEMKTKITVDIIYDFVQNMKKESIDARNMIKILRSDKNG